MGYNLKGSCAKLPISTNAYISLILAFMSSLLSPDLGVSARRNFLHSEAGIVD